MLYILFLPIVLFMAAFAFLILRDAFKKKPTGIYCEYANLWDRLHHSSHVVEVTFLQNEILDWYTDHRDEEGVGEMFEDIMLYSEQRDAELRSEYKSMTASRVV